MTDTRRMDPAAGQRQALLEQLEYLLLEVDALRPLLHEIPREILHGRPLDEPSIVDAFLSIKDRDLQGIQLLEEGALREESLGREGGAEHDQLEIGAVLDLVRAARERLLATLRTVDPAAWGSEISLAADGATTLYDLAYDFAQQDAATLRAMGGRLRTARLSNRDSGF